MNGKKIIVSVAVSISLMAGCKSASNTVSDDKPVPIGASVIRGSRPVRMMPKAYIYKTNGDYDNCVPVTLDASRTQIISFPAPSDLSASSMPVKLDGGYLLDRRGIGANSAFTSYTYQQYMNLPQAPSVEDLLKALIPDARVTEIVEMPFSAGGLENVQRCNELIAAGLPNCKVVYP